MNDGPIRPARRSFYWSPNPKHSTFEHLQRIVLSLFSVFLGLVGLAIGAGHLWGPGASGDLVAYLALGLSLIMLSLPIVLPADSSTQSVARLTGALATLSICAFTLWQSGTDPGAQALMVPTLLVLALTLSITEAGAAALVMAGLVLIGLVLPQTELSSARLGLALSQIAAMAFVVFSAAILTRRFGEIARSQQVESDRFKLIFEHAPVAIAIFDNDLHYIAHTRRWATDYGFPGQDFTGRHHYEVFPEIGDKWKDDHRRNLAGETLHDPEEAFPRADGKVDYVNWTNVPWRQSDGRIGGIIMATQVVTDQVRQRQDLERLNDELENFATTAAHDLKGPIRRMAAFGELIERRYADQFPEDARPLLAQITEGAQKAQMLVKDLLDYARLRDSDVELEALRLSDQIKTLQEEHAALIADSGLQIEVAEDATFLGNTELVSQVFRNLLTNSIRHGASQTPRVEIQIRALEDQIQISWQDNGPGFDPKYETLVFQMFEQLDDEPDTDSTGVGLAMVQRGMERMNGFVSASGNPGVGARFDMTFPKA